MWGTKSAYSAGGLEVGLLVSTVASHCATGPSSCGTGRYLGPLGLGAPGSSRSASVPPSVLSRLCLLVLGAGFSPLDACPLPAAALLRTRLTPRIPGCAGAAASPGSPGPE